jgi:hypothetical protein
VTSSSAEGATAEVWRRRSRRAPALPAAAALLGLDVAALSDATAISLAASEEAAALLDGMELRIRSLKTTVATSTERCVSSVRGPVLWSETITARANALGNDDVFVCATAARSFDTVENRVLVAALDGIARAGRALRGPTGALVAPGEVDRIGAVAAEAQRWRAHPRLADVPPARTSGRDMARIRGGHRLARLAPVLAVRRRLAEPFTPDDVEGLADPASREYHALVVRVLDAVGELTGRTPSLTVSDGGLWSGVVGFRHPAAAGGSPVGLTVRGRAVLPPKELVASAGWVDALPPDGLRIGDGDDLDEVLALVSGGRAPRRR